MNFAAALENERNDEFAEAGPVMSLEAVKPSFSGYVTAANRMVEEAKALEVTDGDRLKYAISLGGEAKKIAKAIEARKREVTADASEYVRKVNGFAKMFTDRLADIEATVKRKIGDYQYKVELERREQERKAKEAAKKLQDDLNRQAGEKGVEAPTVATPVIPKETGPVRTETGTTAYQVKRWVCTVVDAAMVPREYCEPAKRLLDDAVKMGIRAIPGCSIEEIAETRFRT